METILNCRAWRADAHTLVTGYAVAIVDEAAAGTVPLANGQHLSLRAVTAPVADVDEFRAQPLSVIAAFLHKDVGSATWEDWQAAAAAWRTQDGERSSESNAGTAAPGLDTGRPSS